MSVTLSSNLGEPVVRFLKDLIDDARRGGILVPQFQRDFVWKEEDRLDLLRSIRTGIPIGSFFLWQTSQKALKAYPSIGPWQVDGERHPPYNYLLDGYQRLTTLVCALSDPATAPASMPEGPSLNVPVGDIVYDLDDQDFVLRSGAAKPNPAQMSLHLMFDNTALLRFFREKARQADSRADEWMQRAEVLSERFRRYRVVTIPIQTEDTDIAVQAFQRVNSTGQRMGDFHMVRALSVTGVEGLDEAWEEAKSRLRLIGWDSLEDKYLLGIIRAARNLAVARPDAKATAELIRREPGILKMAGIAASRAARQFREQLYIPSPDFLPYTHQFVLLAGALVGQPSMTGPIVSQVGKWLWCTALTGDFRWMRDPELRQSLSDLKSLLTGNGEPIYGPVPTESWAGQFSFNSARAKIMTAMLLRRRLGLLPDKASRTEALEALSGMGAECLPRILRDSKANGAKGLENRFLALSEHERQTLRGRKLLNLPEAHRRALGIDPTAEMCLRADDADGFFERRRRMLAEIEHGFITELGLTTKRSSSTLRS
jgi:hypothetical protein